MGRPSAGPARAASHAPPGPPFAGLAPVGRTTAAQTVARQLLDAIREGGIQPGQLLPPEKELMERLQVGRSTVREALQILATLNVVRASPGQGTFVRELSAESLLRVDLIGFLIANSVALELLEAREMIEPPLMRLACLRATEQDLQRIELLLDEHEAALAHRKPVSAHAARFHVLIAEAAHNRVGLIFMTSILELLMARGRKLQDRPGYLAQEVREHRELLGLLRERDPDRAAEALLRHIIDSAATYDREGVVNGRPLIPATSRRKAKR